LAKANRPMSNPPIPEAPPMINNNIVWSIV
jgi:hypothetical protein